MQGLVNRKQEAEINTDDPLIRQELTAGLTAEKKYISPRFFYDETGSQLFEEITHLPEYYLTRTELALLENHKEEIAGAIGQGQVLIEPGAGNCKKVRQLLPTLKPACYVPIDISGEFLYQAAEQLQLEFPRIKVLPLVDDMQAKVLLPAEFDQLPRTVFYPGSTVGNYTPDEALSFLQHVHEVIGEHGGLLIGVDLHKDSETLNSAYNDAKGTTALFNLNILSHINTLLGTEFEPSLFDHVAFYNDKACRIEMYLESKVVQSVALSNQLIHFKAGERILTEYSYKYSLESFAELAIKVGLVPVKNWVDDQGLFSIQYFHVA